MTDAHIKGKTADEILKDLVSTAEPGSPVHEQQKMAILVRCTDDLSGKVSDLSHTIEGIDASMRTQMNTLTATISTANKESALLANRLYFLNIVLAAATVIASIATAISAYPTAAILAKNIWKLVKSIAFPK